MTLQVVHKQHSGVFKPFSQDLARNYMCDFSHMAYLLHSVIFVADASSLGPELLDLLEYLEPEIREDLNSIYKQPEFVQTDAALQRSER